MVRPTASRDMPLSERLALHSEACASGCLLWTAKINADGYGRLKWNGRHRAAHRLAYEIAYGPIPKGLAVCHRCDVRNCIEPEHLFVGTHTDNMRDMMAKGRHKRPDSRGEKHGNARLTAADVLAIREDKRRVREIARHYKIDSGAISRIRSGERWGHV